MANQTEETGVSLFEQLNAIHTSGRMPTNIRGIIQQKRWQREKHDSGVYYGAPDDPNYMGRYNDPTAKTGVCFTADYAVTAIAESYGREYHKKPKEFFIGSDEVSKAQMCTLQTTRETTTIDMVRLQAILHITADKTMGDDQSITQAVTEWAANTPGLPYDGVTYVSRHLGVGTCTAYWQREGEEGPLKDVDMIPLDKYIDDDKENFPQGWTDPDIDGFEILTETLNFTVVSNNSEEDEED